MPSDRRESLQLCNGSNGYRALLAAECRVVSKADGEIEYVASDETIDSYREIIRVDGWRFNLFQKNSPFVDTHNYSSIEFKLGEVIDWRVDRKQRRLVETVKWAKDVSSNRLAQLGWEMIVNGFGHKAVSVGFQPVSAVSKWDNDRSAWQQQLAALGLDDNSGVRVIYLQQQQIELSACILGANPSAVQLARKAYGAGVLSKRDFDFLRTGKTAPQFQIPFASKTVRPPVDDQPIDDMLQALRSKNGRATRSVESNRDSVLALSGFEAGYLPPLRTFCERALNEIPELRTQVRAVVANVLKLEARHVSSRQQAIIRDLDAGDFHSSAMVPPQMSELVYNGMLLYGAHRTLGQVPIPSGKTRVAQITGEADGYWITPANQGAEVTADASIAGSGTDTDCPTLAANVKVSRPLVEDGKYTFEGALLEALINGLNRRADFACFMADGDADTTDGGQTGIFKHANVPAFVAAAGNTSVAKLEFNDFANTIGSVASGALQRTCRWWINPAFLANLLKLRDGNDRILKAPVMPGADWTLAGFPVTWTAVAPGEDAANKQIAAFGRSDSYMFALRQQFAVDSSDKGPGFNSLLYYFRAFMRAQALMLKATDFAILKTPAS